LRQQIDPPPVLKRFPSAAAKELLQNLDSLYASPDERHVQRILNGIQALRITRDHDAKRQLGLLDDTISNLHQRGRTLTTRELYTTLLNMVSDNDVHINIVARPPATLNSSCPGPSQRPTSSRARSSQPLMRSVTVLRGCVDVANAFSEFLSDEEKASLKAKAIGMMDSMFEEVERRC